MINTWAAGNTVAHVAYDAYGDAAPGPRTGTQIDNKRHPDPKIFRKDEQVFGFKFAYIELYWYRSNCAWKLLFMRGANPRQVLWVDGSLLWNPLLPHDAFDGVWGPAHLVGNYYTVVTSTCGVDVHAQDLPEKSFWKAKICSKAAQNHQNIWVWQVLRNLQHNSTYPWAHATVAEPGGSLSVADSQVELHQQMVMVGHPKAKDVVNPKQPSLTVG